MKKQMKVKFMAIVKEQVNQPCINIECCILGLNSVFIERKTPSYTTFMIFLSGVEDLFVLSARD